MLPPLNFTADEATAIATALAVSGSIPFADAARSALRKVVGGMSAAGRESARELADRIRLLEETGELVPSPVTRAVEAAVLRQRVLEVDYVDKDGKHTARRAVEPFGFAGIGGNWYLMGWCRLRDAGRTFRLDRIQAARVTDEAGPARSLHEVAGDLPDSLRRPEIE